MNCLLLFFRLPITIAYPSGFTSCNVNGPVLPRVGAEVDPNLDVDIQCSKLDCEIDCKSETCMKGFVVAVSQTTIVSFDESVAKRSVGDTCITHKNNNPKQKVTLSLADSPATLHVTVVSRMQDTKHFYATKSFDVARVSGHVYIIGAGPGGLGAARFLATLNYLNFTVFERGKFMVPNFFTQPIALTAYSKTTSIQFNPMMENRSIGGVYMLGTGVGGTQNINGAVYKPGTPDDLALSVGVSVSAASAAQNAASNFVFHNNSMMWQCIDESAGCDYSSVTETNYKMARRSLAYDLPPNVENNIVVDREVKLVDYDSSTRKTRIKFTDATEADVVLTDKDAVILSAGALMSPQLINKKIFTGNNHYFEMFQKFKEFPYDKQTFEYSGSHEFNYANLLWPNTNEIYPNGVWLNISMDMEPTVREMHEFNTSNPVFTEAVSGTQAWHYAGTVPHNSKLIVDDHESNQVYVGDAGGLMIPFNCHTSMPAAAVGIMAAKSWLGVLERDNGYKPIQAEAENVKKWPVALFIAGVFIAAVGVFAHVLSRYNKIKDEKWKFWLRTTHYWFMTISFIFLLSATIYLKMHRTKETRIASDAHNGFGLALLGIMGVQLLLGLLAKYKKGKVKFAHRIFGWTILCFFVLQTWLSKKATVVHFNDSGRSFYLIAAFFTSSVILLGAAAVGVGITPSPKYVGLFF